MGILMIMKKSQKKKPVSGNETAMIKPRELIPLMAQTADPLGSYTGTPTGEHDGDKKPVQDADDL